MTCAYHAQRPASRCNPALHRQATPGRMRRLQNSHPHVSFAIPANRMHPTAANALPHREAQFTAIAIVRRLFRGMQHQYPLKPAIKAASASARRESAASPVSSCFICAAATMNVECRAKRLCSHFFQAQSPATFCLPRPIKARSHSGIAMSIRPARKKGAASAMRQLLSNDITWPCRRSERPLRQPDR